MQPDLIGLEISKGEMRHLIGKDPEDVFRPSIMRDKKKRNGFLISEIIVAVSLTPIIVGIIYGLIVLPIRGSSTGLGILLLITVPIIIFISRWLWRGFTSSKVLTILLDEVDKYHSVVRAIDLNDQLADSGNIESNINDREQIIAALQLIREDLVRALKTERILRDNKQLLADNQSLFVNNLAHLQALQLSGEASQYAQLLNQSLQIALDVQAEIRKLQ